MSSSTFHFSTRNVPAAERLSSWNGSFGRTLSGRLLVPPRQPNGRFHMEMKGRLLAGDGPGRRAGGNVLAMKVTFGGAAQRTRELLSDGNDDVVLHIQVAGRRRVVQCGREAEIKPGGAVLTSNADPSTIVLPGAARFVCIALPRPVMLARAPGLEDALVRPLPPNSGLLRLLTSYLDVLDDDDVLRAPEIRSAVTTHIYDLCALAVGAARDASEVAAGRGLRAARLRAVKADIMSGLVGGDLSAEALARRHGVSPRYIHKLFEQEGTTLSRFRLGLRLARAHAMLRGGRCDLNISEIAYQSGFNDLSTFNREFRRRFGATPSELRSAACSPDDAGSRSSSSATTNGRAGDVR